jgi:hypothetical protein
MHQHEESPMRKPLITILGTLVAMAILATAAVAAPPQPRTFVAPLNGAEEVPPVDTRARGAAIFRLSADGTELSYRLIASNIHDVEMAHIHVAPAGQNGPVVVWLYPDAPPPQPIPGRHDGVLATGTITASDLVGPLAGMAMDDLVAEIRAGDAYVNVHTSQWPGGEIRGQLR